MRREDIVAGLIGAELGAAIGLLVFGGIPMLPLGITLAGVVGGPLLLRGAQPLRLVLFRRWLRAQLRPTLAETATGEGEHAGAAVPEPAAVEAASVPEPAVAEAAAVEVEAAIEPEPAVAEPAAVEVEAATVPEPTGARLLVHRVRKATPGAGVRSR